MKLVKCLHKEKGAEHLTEKMIYMMTDAYMSENGTRFYRILDPNGHLYGYFPNQFEITL